MIIVRVNIYIFINYRYKSIKNITLHLINNKYTCWSYHFFCVECSNFSFLWSITPTHQRLQSCPEFKVNMFKYTDRISGLTFSIYHSLNCFIFSIFPGSMTAAKAAQKESNTSFPSSSWVHLLHSRWITFQEMLMFSD